MAKKATRAGAKTGAKAKRKPAAKRKAPAKKAAPAKRAAKAAARKPARPATAGARRAAKRAGSPPLFIPELLRSAKREPDVVDVPQRTVLSIEGGGGPETSRFVRSIGALYGVAYTLKFSRKPRGKDFKIGPLVGRWWAEGAGVERSMAVAPRESWRWRLRLDVPADVSAEELAAVVRAATSKKGGKLEGSVEASRVALERVPAMRVGRILHVGPYGEEPASFDRIRALLGAAGLQGGSAHQEIYLSDPMRTEPSKLRTVLLLELGS